jgi:CubicO group peptidase (beta-lactamase class C family)
MKYLLLFLVTFAQAQNLPKEIPGAQLVVIKHNKIVSSKTYGVANVEFNVPVTKGTIFSINSIAKIFTGTAIMQLAEAGRIDIEQPIGNYLDSLPQNWRNISLKQLFAHLSGLPDVEEIPWEKVLTTPLLSIPGDTFYYNATNYLLLQKVIEKYSQLPFEQFIQKYQLDVVGMKKTVYGNSYDVVKDKAPTYHYKDNQLLQVYETFPKEFRSDAGIFSTAEEMAKYIIALRSHQLFKGDDLWQPVKKNNGQTEAFDTLVNGYGLGWPMIIRDKHPAAMAIGGGRAAIGIYPQDDVVIILFTNLSGCSPEQIVEKIFYDDIGKSH